MNNNKRISIKCWKCKHDLHVRGLVIVGEISVLCPYKTCAVVNFITEDIASPTPKNERYFDISVIEAAKRINKITNEPITK